MLESNANNVVRAIQLPSSRAPESTIIGDIKSNLDLASCSSVCSVFYSENYVAHMSGSFVFSNLSDKLWLNCSMRFISYFVQAHLVSIE